MDHASVAPRSIAYHLLEEMTNGFSEDRELGSGTYGKVYLGLHKDGEKIAVKVLRPILGLDDEQFEKEYHNLESLRHQNIVRLVGYCNETRRKYVSYEGKLVLAEVTHRALCFEYMQNGSLDSCLSDESSGQDWHTRYAIIKGICKGLKYLHEELKPPIFHLDLKPANILLDENNVPKIADFGLSRLIGEKGTRMTTSSIGTIGYLPPEFINQHVISNKLDIFSLGVIIIKIVTGPTGYSQSAEMSSQEFIDHVHGNWRNRLRATSVDAPQSYCKQVKRCIEIALSCVEVDRHKRPTIGDIINELNETETINQFPDVLRNDPGSSTDQESCQAQLIEVEEKLERETMIQLVLEGMSEMVREEMSEMVREEMSETAPAFQYELGGKPKTKEDREQEAFDLENEDGQIGSNWIKACRYLNGLKAKYGNGKSTLCLVYNATGDTLCLLRYIHWHGDICTPPYPPAIGNGQWAAFRHADSEGMDSVAAVVYRGSNKDGDDYQDYLLAWRTPSSLFSRNRAYCEIGGVDNFQTLGDDDILDKLKNSDYTSDAKSNDGCVVQAKIDKGKSPKFTAIIGCS